MAVEQNKSQMQGFSMMELLVSLVVLSIGLLSLASLHAFAIRYNHGAHLRTVAMLQVSAMADRMRANKLGVEQGHYDNITGTLSNPPSCSTCSPSQTASRDHFEWNSNNQNMLPNGQGTVTANGNLHTITVMWDNERTGATGTNCSNNSAVDLTCLRVAIEL